MKGVRRLSRTALLALALAAVPAALSAQVARSNIGPEVQATQQRATGGTVAEEKGSKPDQLKPVVERALECLEKTVDVCTEPATKAKSTATRAIIGISCLAIVVICTVI